MKITVTKEIDFEPKTLTVSAGVRYWEDATINGQEDEEGTLIPFREGDLWKPKIDVATGRILDWPEGMVASIHYKVCDAGEYWLDDGAGTRVKYRSDYVPSALDCSEDRSGYGDYIILDVDGTGQIAQWSAKRLDGKDWQLKA